MTLISKVKVIWRSWWYMACHLMIIHLHTKYHKSMSKYREKLQPGQDNSLNSIIWPWDLRSRACEGRDDLIIIHPNTKYHKSISKDKRVTAWIREFPKFNYLTLRSEVKVMWRSWWSMIQHLMIIHLHTKYHKSISKGKRITAPEQGCLSTNRIRRRKSPLLKQYVSLHSFVEREK